MTDIDKIADLVEDSMFFVQAGVSWLRINYCDMEEGSFHAMDENTGEEYKIMFDEVDLSKDKFMKLVENNN